MLLQQKEVQDWMRGGGVARAIADLQRQKTKAAAEQAVTWYKLVYGLELDLTLWAMRESRHR